MDKLNELIKGLFTQFADKTETKKRFTVIEKNVRALLITRINNHLKNRLRTYLICCRQTARREAVTATKRTPCSPRSHWEATLAHHVRGTSPTCRES
jgi:hypothetical protein